MLALLEKTANGYRAATGKPLEAEALGSTREETPLCLWEIVSQRLIEGAELVELDLEEPYLRERKTWLHISAVQGAKAFAETEPEYPLSSIIEINPDFWEPF